MQRIFISVTNSKTVLSQNLYFKYLEKVIINFFINIHENVLHA